MRRWRPWRSRLRQVWFVATGLMVLCTGRALASFASGLWLPSQAYGAWTKRSVPVSRPIALRSHPAGNPPGVDDAIDLPGASLRIMEALRAAPAVRTAEPQDVAYEAPPALSEVAVWQEFEGNFSRSGERPFETFDYTKWIALQLSIHDWDQLVEKMRDTGLMARMNSTWIADVMVECCRRLFDQFSVHTAFTQGNEIILLFAPREHYRSSHDLKYRGRVHKWVTIAPSLCTWEFTSKLNRFAEVEGIELESPLAAHFVGHASVLDSELEVSAFLLWRAREHGAQALRTACREGGGPSPCADNDLTDQVAWLRNSGHLPLAPHQAYGTLLRMADMEINVTNPINNMTVPVWRGFVIHINDGSHGTPRNLLNFCRSGFSLMPDEGDESLQLRPGSFWRTTKAQPSSSQQGSVKLYKLKSKRKGKRRHSRL